MNGVYTQIVDRSSNTTEGSIASPIEDTFTPVNARYVKLTIVDADDASYNGEWVAITEFRVFGKEIENAVAVTGVELTPATIDLEVDETEQLTATISPVDATNQALIYTSSDPSVATVSATGEVTAVGEGTATITVTTSDGSYTDTSTITVTEPYTPPSVVNLALGKTVTESGTHEAPFAPSELVDDDPSDGARWSVSGYPQSATVDLGDIYELERTELVCFSGRAYQYTIEVASDVNGPYTQIVDRSNNSTTGTVASPIEDTFTKTNARYVKLTIVDADDASYGGEWVAITEFRVFGKEIESIALDLKVFLQGAFSSDKMNGTLDQNDLVPLISPYPNIIGYDLVNDSTPVEDADLSIFVGDDAIVDWVFVELRSDETTVVATRSGLLQMDGDIVDLDGGALQFSGVSPGSYYVVIRHRNHLGIMTKMTIDIN